MRAWMMVGVAVSAWVGMACGAPPESGAGSAAAPEVTRVDAGGEPGKPAPSAGGEPATIDDGTDAGAPVPPLAPTADAAPDAEEDAGDVDAGNPVRGVTSTCVRVAPGTSTYCHGTTPATYTCSIDDGGYPIGPPSNECAPEPGGVVGAFCCPS